MKELVFKIACKTCMEISSFSKFIFINGPDDELFENEKLKSEYELNKYIVKYLKETKQPCEFCGSYNLDIFDIEFDGEKAYNHLATYFDQLQVIIMKRNDRQDSIELEKGFDANFIRKVFDTIINEINFVPNICFEEKSKGHIKFVVSKKTIAGKDIFRIQRFSFVGYSKDKTLSILTSFKEKLNNFYS